MSIEKDHDFDKDKQKPSQGKGRGGRRPGAGRPKGTGKWGEPTKAVRLPISKLDQILLFTERLCMNMPEEFTVTVTDERPKIPKPPKMDRTFGCPMPDDSMSPEIRKGEIAMIYPQFEPQNGDLVLAYYHGRLYIRRYERSKGTITLTPGNRSYKTIQAKANAFEIYGVVKDKIVETQQIK